jgi:DnaJ-class molecular chaperone
LLTHCTPLEKKIMELLLEKLNVSNLYELFQVKQREDDTSVIKQAFFKKVQEYHPSVKDNTKYEENLKTFELICDAYGILYNSNVKKEYDDRGLKRAVQVYEAYKANKSKPFQTSVRVDVSIGDIYTNKEIEVKYERTVLCKTCYGFSLCPICYGTGTITVKETVPGAIKGWQSRTIEKKASIL